MTLADAYGRRGMHEAALRVLDRIDALTAHLHRDGPRCSTRSTRSEPTTGSGLGEPPQADVE